MKRLALLGFVMSLFLFGNNAHAEEIQNLKISPTEKYTLIQWDHVSDSIQAQTEGYALQWGTYINKMRNIDPYVKLVKGTRNELSVFTSAVFEDAKTDYFYLRVYTYVKDGRQTTLSNGSKVLKFKLNYALDEVLESEYLEPNDPVISEDTESSTVFDFGKLRVVPYDTYATFSWSRPNLSRSDANGIIIALSKEDDTDFSDPLVELTAGLDITSGKIDGLDTETKYIARGYFYKIRAGEKQKFGSGSSEEFTTSKAMTASQKARIERLRQRGLIRDRALVTATVGGESTIDDSTDTSSEEEATSTSSSSSSSTSTSGSYTKSEIQAKIRELESELVKWKNKLKALTGNSRTTSSSSSSRSNSGLSAAMQKLCAKHPKLPACNR